MAANRLSAETVRALARAGNRGLLERLAQLGKFDMEGSAAARSTHPVEHAFLFPATTPEIGFSPGLLCDVRVELGEWSIAFSGPTRDAAEAALAEAQRYSGSAITGLVASSSVLDRLVSDGVNVELDGSSHSLAVFLAGVARLTSSRPRGIILGTGCLEERVDRLEQKALIASEASFPRPTLLLASRPAPEELHGWTLVDGPERAVLSSFLCAPWRADQPIQRIHAFTGDKREPPLGWGTEALPLAGPATLDPASMAAHCELVKGRVLERTHVELSWAGPVMGAAWLGDQLANRRTQVQFIHETSHNRAWNTDIKHGIQADVPKADRVRVLLTSGTGPAPQGWERFELPTALAVDPGETLALLEKFVKRFGSYGNWDLAFQAPGFFAFAAGQVLGSFRRGVTYFHLGHAGYEPWFRSCRSPAP